MNAQSQITAADGLETITALFDGLGEEGQLFLLDYLADRTPYADELGEGMASAAVSYGKALSGGEEWAASTIADGVFPSGCSREAWTRHRQMRDRTLRYALRDRSKPFNFDAGDIYAGGVR